MVSYEERYAQFPKKNTPLLTWASIITTLASIVLGLGWCNSSKKYNQIKTKLEKMDSVYKGITSKLENKAEDINNAWKKYYHSYKDTLNDLVALYNESEAKRKGLEKNLRAVQASLNEFRKRENLEGRALKDYHAMKNKYDSLAKDREILERDHENLAKKYILLNKDYAALKSKSGENYSSKIKIAGKEVDINSKDKKSPLSYLFSPKMELIDEGIVIRHPKAREVDAFAFYPESGRKEPLVKNSHKGGDNLVIFKYPAKFLELENSSIEVYAVDKKGRESKKRIVYICKGVISLKKICY